MDLNDYISSGAIEAYVMGLADDQDRIELWQMEALYPEVKAFREKLEIEQEIQHLHMAANVPPGVEDKLFAKLEIEFRTETPVVVVPSKGANGKPLVVPIMPTPKPMKWLQSAVAVSAILLMGSLILNFYFYSKSVSYRDQNTSLLISQKSLLTNNKAMKASLEMVKDPAVKQVVMGSMNKFTGSLVTVYWDTRTRDVYLMVNNLPNPSPEKQYQLWAIVNGKPVDAGMLNIDVPEEGSPLHKMHNIPNAEAFAITLEKKGGSPAPTMDALYVYGKV